MLKDGWKGSWSPSALSVGEGPAFPYNPIPIVAGPLGPAPPLVVVAALTFVIVSSLTSPPKGGGPESFLFLSWRLSKGGSQQAGFLSSLIVAAFSGLARWGGPESLLLFPLTGGSVASPRPPSNRRPLASSTGCPRRLYVRTVHSSSVLSSRLPKGRRPRELPPLNWPLLPALKGFSPVGYPW